MKHAALTLAVLGCFATLLVPSPASATCNEQRTEVLGVGDQSMGAYSREKSNEYGSCRYDSWSTWEENCTATVLNPWDTPSSVGIPEVRVLGQVVVPQTSVPVPSVHVPGVYAPSRATDDECGVSEPDYGVYDGGREGSYDGNYVTYLGTDGCDQGRYGYSPFLLGWGWLGYYVCPLVP